MGDPISISALTTGAIGGIKDAMDIDLPGLPPPVEEADEAAQRQLSRATARRRKGRRSTILAGMGTGSGGHGKKTVLG